MEKITKEDLQLITNALSKKNQATLSAEKAIYESRLATLEHQVTVQHIFLKYNLTFEDNIDDVTGEIKRAQKQVVVENSSSEDFNEVG